jgi:hypothetical protein
VSSNRLEFLLVAGWLALTTGCEPIVSSVGAWEEEIDASLYFEAESGELTGGFSTGEDAAASAGVFISPPSDEFSDDVPGAAFARYEFSLPKGAEYVFWARLRAPGANSNRFWFQIDGGDFRKWRISVGDIWYWDDLHDDTDYGNALSFALGAGTHELVFANAVAGADLDRLYITAEGDVPPGNETLCSPPHSIEIAGECLPSCGAQQGTLCGQVACEGKELILAYDCDVCCREVGLGP